MSFHPVAIAFKRLEHGNRDPGKTHAIGQKVNSVDADQQISGSIEDLDHWIQNQPEWAQDGVWMAPVTLWPGIPCAADGC